MKKVYVVTTSFNDIPKILGIFTNKQDAERVAYSKNFWTCITEKEINKEYLIKEA